MQRVFEFTVQIQSEDRRFACLTAGLGSHGSVPDKPGQAGLWALAASRPIAVSAAILGYCGDGEQPMRCV